MAHLGFTPQPVLKSCGRETDGRQPQPQRLRGAVCGRHQDRAEGAVLLKPRRAQLAGRQAADGALAVGAVRQHLGVQGSAVGTIFGACSPSRASVEEHSDCKQKEQVLR